MRWLAPLLLVSCAAPAPPPQPPSPAPVAPSAPVASTNETKSEPKPEPKPEPQAEVDAGAIVPRPVDVRLPGACVDPTAHAAKLGGNPGASPMEVGDLDGDGVTDVVLAGNATNITGDLFLFVMRGKCGHFVGKLVTEARGLQPSTAKNRGLFDLVGDRACRKDCCAETVEHTFRFDGSVYRPSSTKPVKRSCSSYAP